MKIRASRVAIVMILTLAAVVKAPGRFVALAQTPGPMPIFSQPVESPNGMSGAASDEGEDDLDCLQAWSDAPGLAEMDASDREQFARLARAKHVEGEIARIRQLTESTDASQSSPVIERLNALMAFSRQSPELGDSLPALEAAGATVNRWIIGDAKLGASDKMLGIVGVLPIFSSLGCVASRDMLT